MTELKTPIALKIALWIGLAQAVAILVYAASIGILHLQQGTQGATGSDVSPWFLILTYVAFASLILWVIFKLNRQSGAARTPYLLTQAFAIVIAQALVSGSETAEIIGGWILIVLAAIGAISILTPAASKNLNLNR